MQLKCSEIQVELTSSYTCTQVPTDTMVTSRDFWGGNLTLYYNLRNKINKECSITNSLFLTKQNCQIFKKLLKTRKLGHVWTQVFHFWTDFFGPIPTVPTVVVCKTCCNELMLKYFLWRSRIMLHDKTGKKKPQTSCHLPFFLWRNAFSTERTLTICCSTPSHWRPAAWSPEDIRSRRQSQHMGKSNPHLPNSQREPTATSPPASIVNLFHDP